MTPTIVKNAEKAMILILCEDLFLLPSFIIVAWVSVTYSQRTVA